MRAWLALLIVLPACSGRSSPVTVLGKQATRPAHTASVAPPALPAASVVSAPTATPVEEPLVMLAIPDRKQDPKSPPSGWCGETAIQEGLLHLGVWAPQALIHRAGKSKHPDLYSDEIPTALTALGVRYERYAPKNKGFEAYGAWVREALDHGDPVLAGVKILPTDHPDWGLDHFVLAVGYGSRGLLVNTTWGERRWVGDTTTPGLSFKNAFYAIRLRAVSLPSNAHPARLTALEETALSIKLRIECASVLPGATVRLEQTKYPWDVKPVWSETISVAAARVERVLTIETASPARFHCVAL